MRADLSAKETLRVEAGACDPSGLTDYDDSAQLGNPSPFFDFPPMG